MPTITVIVPVYKVEPYLHRCIDSILAQTYTDFELILVDDGSPDNCGAICDEYAAKDNRIHVIHQANGGLSAARNAGIDWAFANRDSEWLSFVDGDDWVHPKSLEALVNGAEQTGLSVVIGGFERTEGENPAVDETALSATVCDTEEYFCEHNVNAIVAWGKIYHKECFQTIRYPVGKIHEDEFTTYKILFEFDKLAVIDQPLYAYYQNPNGIMNERWSLQKLNWLEAFEQQVRFFEEHNFRKAQLRQVGICFWCIELQLKELEQCDGEDNSIKILLTHERKLLREYGKHYPIRKNIEKYIHVYPLLGVLRRYYYKLRECF